MFILNINGKASVQVEQMYNYMIKAGLHFESTCFSDSSPYAILGSGTAIGYRTRSKWGKKGIVFFCSSDGVDMNALVNKMGLLVDDNSARPERPFAIFVPETRFEEAVVLLLQNPANR